MEIFFNPLFMFWLFIALFFVFKKARLKKTAKIFLFTGFIQLAISTLTPLPELLVYSLESRYPVFNPHSIKNSTKKYYIMVLDGGHSNSEQLPLNQRLSTSTLSRLSEGIRLSNMLSNSFLLCSGDINDNDINSVCAVTGAAKILGAKKNEVISLVKSSDTNNEAENFKKRFGINKNIILVTSAIHMPRAVKIFNKHGLNVIPAPSDFYVKKEDGKTFISFGPGYLKIRNMEKAIHEYMGIFYYTYIK